MNPAEHILRTLASHLEGPAEIRLMGGAALVLGYGLDRATEIAEVPDPRVSYRFPCRFGGVARARDLTSGNGLEVHDGAVVVPDGVQRLEVEYA